MIEFLRSNSEWLTPVLVAVVTGVFYLIKKGGNHNKQSAKNINNSSVNQANGDQAIQGGSR